MTSLLGDIHRQLQRYSVNTTGCHRKMQLCHHQPAVRASRLVIVSNATEGNSPCRPRCEQRVHSYQDIDISFSIQNTRLQCKTISESLRRTVGIFCLLVLRAVHVTSQPSQTPSYHSLTPASMPLAGMRCDPRDTTILNALCYSRQSLSPTNLGFPVSAAFVREQPTFQSTRCSYSFCCMSCPSSLVVAFSFQLLLIVICQCGIQPSSPHLTARRPVTLFFAAPGPLTMFPQHRNEPL